MHKSGGLAAAVTVTACPCQCQLSSRRIHQKLCLVRQGIANGDKLTYHVTERHCTVDKHHVPHCSQ